MSTTSTTTDHEIKRIHQNLFIRTNDELHEFWRAILPDFVEFVDPEKSGFLRELYAAEMLTHTDYESLVTGIEFVPRKQKARQLLLVLEKHPLEIFLSKIAPKLCKRYGEIIPKRFFATPEERTKLTSSKHGTTDLCLRHDIQNHVRPDTMADLLCHYNCLTFVTGISNAPLKNWDLLFGAFRNVGESNRAEVVSATQDLLERYHVNVKTLDRFPELLSQGFPCTCRNPVACPPDGSLDSNQQVQSWLERKLATVGQPSPDSSLTNVDVSASCSPASTLRSVSQLDDISISSENTLVFDKRLSEDPHLSPKGHTWKEAKISRAVGVSFQGHQQSEHVASRASPPEQQLDIEPAVRDSETHGQIIAGTTAPTHPDTNMRLDRYEADEAVKSVWNTRSLATSLAVCGRFTLNKVLMVDCKEMFGTNLRKERKNVKINVKAQPKNVRQYRGSLTYAI
ncbi:hypothetical protein BaRGS_00032031 [Batillaria attramentaria]|uniref:Uncharacterized protein n=1 Tax=Batillaria attramentaria TaxID=370345 RepID=A0ABD0JNT8_9CAEN